MKLKNTLIRNPIRLLVGILCCAGASMGAAQDTSSGQTDAKAVVVVPFRPPSSYPAFKNFEWKSYLQEAADSLEKCLTEEKFVVKATRDMPEVMRARWDEVLDGSDGSDLVDKVGARILVVGHFKEIDKIDKPFQRGVRVTAEIRFIDIYSSELLGTLSTYTDVKGGKSTEKPFSVEEFDKEILNPRSEKALTPALNRVTKLMQPHLKRTLEAMLAKAEGPRETKKLDVPERLRDVSMMVVVKGSGGGTSTADALLNKILIDNGFQSFAQDQMEELRQESLFNTLAGGGNLSPEQISALKRKFSGVNVVLIGYTSVESIDSGGQISRYRVTLNLAGVMLPSGRRVYSNELDTVAQGTSSSIAASQGAKKLVREHGSAILQDLVNNIPMTDDAALASVTVRISGFSDASDAATVAENVEKKSSSGIKTVKFQVTNGVLEMTISFDMDKLSERQLQGLIITAAKPKVVRFHTMISGFLEGAIIK